MIAWRNLVSWAAVIAGLAMVRVAYGGGQFVGDNGSAGMQRAGAFVAKADDATAMYYNPAGLANVHRQQLFIGLNIVHMAQRFQRAGSYQEQPVFPEPQPGYVDQSFERVEHAGTQPIPFIALAYPMGRLTLGAGVFAPHGSPGRNYPETVRMPSGASAPAPQRYDTVSQTGGTVLPSLALAFRLAPWLSIGARASWGVAWADSTKYVQGQPSSSEQPGQDSRVSLSVTDPFIFTYGGGVHARLAAWFEVGLAYSAPVHIRAKGTIKTEMGQLVRVPGEGVTNELVPVADDQARCARGGTVDAIKACLRFSLPQTATVAARWIFRDAAGRERTDVELDVRWENWRAASDYTIVSDAKMRLSTEDMVLTEQRLDDSVIKHGLDDVVSVRLGVGHRIADYQLRAGVSYDTAAAPPSWSRLDLDGGARFTASAGVGISLASMRVDIGLGYVYLPDRIVQDQPVADVSDIGQRVQPDVTVPILTSDQQPHHPFNAGVHSSRYLVGSLGVTTWW